METKKTIIAPVGDNMEALFVGLRDYSADEIILITPKENVSKAKMAKAELEKFHIKVIITEINGNIWEEMFAKISEISSAIKDREIIINTSTGDRNTQCATTSAAFVNGLKAISVEGGEAMLLPILKFSYYSLLTERKMKLLQLISKKDCCASLEELAKRAKMSLPLISYHINGNRRSEGLKELGLVQTTPQSGRIRVSLTMLGRLLLKGYVKPKEK